MRALRRMALLVPLLLALPACDAFEPEPNRQLLDQLNAAESRWRTSGAPDYSYVLVRRCSCPLPPPLVRVEVAGNAVVGATFVDSGDPVPPSQLSQFRPLPGYFDLIREAIGRRLPQFHVTYDPERGFPRELVINYDITTATDDIWLEINGFTLTTP